jgi:hypothetical protein
MMDTDAEVSRIVQKGVLYEFISQLGKTAEENWSPERVDELEQLIGTVLTGCRYGQYRGAEETK